MKKLITLSAVLSTGMVSAQSLGGFATQITPHASMIKLGSLIVFAFLGLFFLFSAFKESKKEKTERKLMILGVYSVLGVAILGASFLTDTFQDGFEEKTGIRLVETQKYLDKKEFYARNKEDRQFEESLGYE